MVAETCIVSGSWMLCFARANEGLAGFLGKILVALKNYFSLQFSLFLGTVYAYQKRWFEVSERYLVYVYYTVV